MGRPKKLKYLWGKRIQIREAAKKVIFLSGPATKRGKVRAWPLRIFFFFEALKNTKKNTSKK